MSDTGIAHLAKLRLLLHRDGIRSALGYLNSLAGHRFTAVNRLDATTCHALHFFDREHPWVEAASDIPVNASYCMLVLERHQPLAIADARDERWLDAHPAQRDVRSYCGVPLPESAGCSGTLCHFDTAPRAPGDGTIELMQAFAGLLPRVAARLH